MIVLMVRTPIPCEFTGMIKSAPSVQSVVIRCCVVAPPASPSQALARNSDVFAAGVDMASVHLWGSSLDTADVSYRSSDGTFLDRFLKERKVSSH